MAAAKASKGKGKGKEDKTAKAAKTRAPKSNGLSKLLTLGILITLGVGFYLLFSLDDGAEPTEADWKAYDAYLDMGEKELPTPMELAQYDGDEVVKEAWWDPYFRIIPIKKVKEAVQGKEVTTVFYYLRHSHYHKYQIKRAYSYLARELKKKYNVTIFAADIGSKMYEELDPLSKEEMKALESSHRRKLFPGTPNVFIYKNGDYEKPIPFHGNFGPGMLESFESHLGPAVESVEEWADLRLEERSTNEYLKREYFLLSFTEEIGKLESQLHKLADTLNSENADFFYAFQTTNLDLLKGKVFLDSEGNSAKPGYGDVAMIRQDDSSAFLFPRDLRTKEEFLKSLWDNVIPRNKVLDAEKLSRAVKKKLDNMDEHDEMLLRLIYDGQIPGNRQRMENLGKKLLEKYKGQIYPLIVMEEKEKFLLYAQINPEQAFVKNLMNTIQAKNAYRELIMKREVTAQNAYAFLDKFIADTAIMLQDEL